MRSFGLNLLILGISVALGLAGIEIFLRAFKPQTLAAAQSEPIRGWENQPLAEFDFIRAEFEQRVRYNEHGFHDISHSLAKPLDKLRIAIVGDSFVEAKEVALEKSFVQILQQKFFLKGRDDVEVLNFGISGYGSGQELVLLKERVLTFSPDIVVMVFTENDLTNNLCDNPYALVDDKLILKTAHTGNSFTQALRTWLRAHSHTYVFFKDRLTELFAGPVYPTGDRGACLAELVQSGIPPHLAPSVIPPPQTMAKAWRITREIFIEISRTLKERGIPWLLMTTTTHFKIHDEAWQKTVTDHHFDLKKLDRDLANRELQALANDLAVPFLDPLATMRDLYRQGKSPHFVVDGHWNEAGHVLAAEMLFESLIAHFPILKPKA